MDLDYDFVLEAEFDALNLEKKDYEAWSSKKYPAKAHARKVASELGVDDGLIYLPGLPTVNYEDSDQPPPIRQRRYFYYITGANFHDCAATYEIAHDRLILWIPHVEPRQVLWFGSTPNAAKAMERYDIDEARYNSQLPKFFEAYLKPSVTLFLLHAHQRPSLSTAALDVDHTRLRPAMDRARCIKDAYEIAMIRRANEVSGAAHRRVAESLLGLTNEREIEAIFQAVCTARGTRTQAYPIIVGSGTNASVLHYEDNNQPLKDKELVVLDAGCEWDCYASDITRTLPLSGHFSPEAAAVYSIVQQMQEECIAAVKPGAMFYKLHLHAAAVGLAGLLKLGILRGNVAEIADAGTMSAFFPHGLGHYVGLEVHDVSGDGPLMSIRNLGVDGAKREMVTPSMLSAFVRMDTAASSTARTTSPRNSQPLQPNMIVTIEPGIYFCRDYIESYFLVNPTHAKFIDENILEQYYSVGGVRIEDDILVTEDGYENLSTAPKGKELFELINRGKTGLR